MTSGQSRILPVLQLLLTRTNQNKPEVCRCGVSPGFVWGQEVVEGKGVVKYSSLHTDKAMCEEGGGLNFNHIKILIFQLMMIMLYVNKKFVKSQLMIKFERQRGGMT